MNKILLIVAFFLLSMFSLFFNEVRAQNVFISEVMYDSPLNEQIATGKAYSNGEYVEIYNSGNSNVDLTGWSLHGDGKTEIFNFPSGTKIASCSFLIIAYQYNNSNFQLSDLYNQMVYSSEQVLYQRKVILSNSGESVVLKDHNLITRDSIFYDGTSNKTKPNRLWAENPDDIQGMECKSLQRVKVKWNGNGSCITDNSDWETAFVSPLTNSNLSILVGAEPTQNYTLTRLMLSADASQYMDNIQYYDGLGRPYETVQKGITPSKSNLVSYLEYDTSGRESNQWLPIVTGNNYVDYPDLLQEANYYYSTDSRPYSYPVYESSSLNRVVAQYGPGEAWNDHPISTDFFANTSFGDLCCKYYSVNNSGALVCNGDYPIGQLYVTKNIDEDGRFTYTFTDKLERTILTRQLNNGEYVDTYYVYDEQGNQRYVLPPLASDELQNSGTYTLSDNNVLGLYAYYYRYDYHNQCIVKKLPGIEPIYMIYDKDGRLAFSQDGNQRKKYDWIFYAYDKLDRLLYKKSFCVGEEIPYDGLDIMVEAYNEIYMIESFVGANYNAGYTDTWGFEGNFDTKMLIVNYYDNYQFLDLLPSNVKSELSYTLTSGYGIKYDNARGLLTGTQVYNLDGSGNYVTTAFYYDSKGNQVQVNSTNHLGGYDKSFTNYSFTDKPVLVKHMHSGIKKLTEIYNYVYDHADRLIKVTHQLDDDAAVTLAENSYDEFGRLRSKKIKDGLDVVSYDYNIRSWLTSINSTSFNQKLRYEQRSSGARICYNGNISSMDWSISEDFTRRYNFLYDDLNRLRKATYLESKLREDFGSTHYEHQPNYDAEYTYDKQGNIKSLTRSGLTEYEDNRVGCLYQTFIDSGTIDYLSLTHKGNQVTKIDDLADEILYRGSFDFVDGYKGLGVEYLYDENGNMIQDRNKGVSQIQYNLLNLPDKIQFQSGHMTNTGYDADGVKYRVSHLTAIDNVSVPMGNLMPLSEDQIKSRLVTDYCGNVIYENGELKKVLIDGGYISFTYNRPSYHFYVKDHQGNNRVVLADIGGMEESNHYYPFGGVFGESSRSTDTDPYKYNGKELDRMHGLNWYDYSARQYDPMGGGGFPTMDPLCEKYYSISPYAYCGNNPVNRIDPDGRDWYEDEFGNVYWQEGSDEIEGYNNIGTCYSIEIMGGTYLNYYQNVIVSESNKPANSFNTIRNSPALQNRLLGKNSPLSEDSKSQLFNGLVNRETSEIGQTVGQALLTAEAIYSGASAVYSLGRLGGNLLGSGVKGILKPLGLGSTGRTVAANLTEQLAMKEIMSNPTLGKVVMKGMKDNRWSGWNKMQYTHTALDGIQTTIHYVGKFENGILKAVDDFKFK